MKGSKGHMVKEGGLSKALRSDSGAANGDPKAQQDEGYSSHRAGSQHGEAQLFGRSPSRNFVSANHLLNFQFDRSRVRFL